MRYFQTNIFPWLIVSFITSIFLYPVNVWSAYKMSLSDTHIQSTLVRHFPIREYAAFARITLHEPQIILSSDSKDLLLIIPVEANIPDQPQKKGHARIAVKVIYRPGNGGLYLNKPRLVEFEMPNISNSLIKQLKTKIASMCENALPLIQIFKIKEEVINHSLGKSILKSHSIKDGSINMEFGFD